MSISKALFIVRMRLHRAWHEEKVGLSYIIFFIDHHRFEVFLPRNEKYESEKLVSNFTLASHYKTKTKK